MHKTLYEFHGVPLNTWGLVVTLAFGAAALFCYRRMGRVGIDPDHIVPIVILAAVGGLMGARLLHFTMAEPEALFSNPMVYFNMGKGGFAVMGGHIGGAVAVVAYVLARGIPVWKMADIVAPPIMLAQAIGRVGCFFAGCCHGAPVDLPAGATPLLPTSFAGGQVWFAPQYPFVYEMTHDGVGVNDQVVYATQVYEIGASLLIFLVGSLVFHTFRKFDGMVAAMMIAAYATWRPYVETMRGDTVRGVGYFGHFSTSQVMSGAFLIGAVVIVLLRATRGVAPETPFAAPDDGAGGVEGSAPKL
jgi:phosphatidylglycerol:prolipoprotein diacylglycerol transferase